MNNNKQQLYSQFDSGVNWNALLYIVQKVLTTILTFVLFKKLTSIGLEKDFSIWTNINCIIFLILLWVDFGFRKSIPRYVPEFSKNYKYHIWFTKFIIKFQLIALILASLFFIFKLKSIFSVFSLNLQFQIILLASAIFFLEAPIALFRLIYHAHFWNKEFNLLYSIVITIETGVSLFFIFFITGQNIISTIMIIKVLSGIVINVVATVLLFKLYSQKKYLVHQEIDYYSLRTDFVKHSGIMWGNTVLKSLTERNFVIPLLTMSLGSHFSNIFKIANDAALLFQRIILKTIGTTDTALLSYLQLDRDQNLISEGFKKIVSTIFRISMLILIVILFLFPFRNYFFESFSNESLILKAFIILITCYLLEAILSTYERVLEVKRRYWILLLAYSPFLIFLYLSLNVFLNYRLCSSFEFLNEKFLSSIGLLGFIILLSSVRLLSSLIITLYARKKYNLRLFR